MSKYGASQSRPRHAGLCRPNRNDPFVSSTFVDFHQNLETVLVLADTMGRGLISDANKSVESDGFDCCCCVDCASCGGGWWWTPLGPSMLQTDSSTPVSSTLSGFLTALPLFLLC
jgi:hypothetical protein